MPSNTVYVGRGSKWGNPFPLDHQKHLGKAWACEAYAQWLHTNFYGMRLLRDHLPELRGKNLACWCKPHEACHADVLLSLANGKRRPAASEKRPTAHPRDQVSEQAVLLRLNPLAVDGGAARRQL